MTASEFAFLALGLVLGAASGAALVEVLRSRPPSRREIRVTVAPNSIPRRGSTLTEADAVDRGPARGGPADRRDADREGPPDDDSAGPGALALAAMPTRPIDASPAPMAIPVGGPSAGDDRTTVPFEPSNLPPFRLAGAGAAGGAIALPGPRPPIGIAIAREPDPMVAALRATAAATATVAVAAANKAGSGERRGKASVARGAGADGARPGDAADDACADPRRVSDERCLVATRAREGAVAALEALRTNQRTYDDLVTRAEAESAAADPLAIRAAKEAAQQTFRLARAGGRTRDDVEASARDWLTDINRINQETRESTAAAERHRRAAAEIAPTLERLSVEADAARISAEMAEEACIVAREAVAACQEAAVLAAASGATAPAAEIPPAVAPVDDEGAVLTPMGSRAGEDAAIIRLLRGDREVMTRMVARLGGEDEAARRHWQGLLGEFVEAVIGRTIEASAFDFPDSNSFWKLFTRSQARDIAAALGSLGYRHDGFGGWADERIPSQRDLSLAVGYAGLDPMRIRRWPSDTEMPDLLRNVTVAADEYLWEAAGGLTLGELVSMLGRRADALAELWNEWGVVRPMLLSAD